MTAQLVRRNGPRTPEKCYFDYVHDGWLNDPNKIAVISVDTDESLTYGQLENRVLLMAGYLQKLGVKSQSKVQFFCRNSINSLIAQQAAMFCNAVIFLYKVNDTVKLPEYKQQTDESEVKYIITDATDYDLVVHRYLEEVNSAVEKVLIVDGMPKNAVISDKVILIGKLAGHSFIKPNNVNIKTDTCFVSYTSGSTGVPKGVMISTFALVASLNNCRHSQLTESGDRFLLMSTLTYISGIAFSCGILAVCGTFILAHHGYDPDLPLLIEKYNATAFMLLECPMKTVMQNTHRFPNLPKMLSTVRKVLVGGTLFPDNLRNQMYEVFKGAKFIHGYGQTESAGSVTMAEYSDIPVKHVGTACLNTDVRLVRDDGSLVNNGETGEIQWRGDQMLLGYWKRECNDWTDDGFFATGDLGVVNEHGNLEIVGRKKDFIICLDERISPIEVEDVLMQHPAVDEVIVVGVPHPVVVEAPTAMVVIQKAFKKSEKFDEQALRTELIEYVAARLVDYKQLHGGVHFVDSLDKTESGKYSRHKITQRALKFLNV